MQTAPDTPPLEDAPESLCETGHLWLLEAIDGAPFRFQVEDSGLIRFGDDTRVFHPEGIPLQYHHAVRHVRERLDRGALRAAVEEVEDVVFFGTATYQHAIDYDWERMPSFLGTDVWLADDERYLTFDAVEGIFERLGLQAVNAFERERRARDFDSDTYTIPDSAWYDGPAAGVVVRNKRGERGEIHHPSIGTTPSAKPVDVTAEELAVELATDERFGRITIELEASGQSVTVEALTKRVFEDILREEHRRLVVESGVDLEDVRSAVAARTREHLGYGSDCPS